jgi:hypothetical protein
VGRSSAGRSLDDAAVTLAVIAFIRHRYHTTFTIQPIPGHRRRPRKFAPWLEVLGTPGGIGCLGPPTRPTRAPGFLCRPHYGCRGVVRLAHCGHRGSPCGVRRNPYPGCRQCGQTTASNLAVTGSQVSVSGIVRAGPRPPMMMRAARNRRGAFRCRMFRSRRSTLSAACLSLHAASGAGSPAARPLPG